MPSHSGTAVDTYCDPLAYHTVPSDRLVPRFRRNTQSPSSRIKLKTLMDHRLSSLFLQGGVHNLAYKLSMFFWSLQYFSHSRDTYN
jgi:hypothetical protein